MYQKPEYCFLQSRQRRRSEDCDELNDLFNKKFQFRFNSAWKLPDEQSWFSDPPWQVKQLETLKTRLNFHKSQLNDFNIEEWSSHTRRRNPAGEVGWKIRCLINPEFLTQAWTKFYECACTYDIVPAEAIADREMVSLHLCEAPGAFITSLNHYLKSRHTDIDWKWVANTLNPYYEGNSPSNMISDDRFMFHTLDNWDFGVDNTGNLMQWDNSQAIVEKVKSLGKVLLVTADGSIDCLQRPDDQEEVTSPLHYCEIITALQALSPGGTLVFKLFTMFEHSTVNLLFLVNHLFGEVNIYKPVTSRQGNSEVYAVCLRYEGIEHLHPYISLLKSAYGTESYSNLSLFPLQEVPESFIRQVEECALYFSSMQCQVINNNLQAYLMQNNIAFHRDIKKIRAAVATDFLWRYNLKPLDVEREVLKGILHEDNKINTNPRYHRGSYTERQLYTEMTLKDKCNYLNTFLQGEEMAHSVMLNDQINWIFNDEKLTIDIAFTYGFPLHNVNSSKFIFVPILKLYQQIIGEGRFREIISRPSGRTNTDDLKDMASGVDKILCLPKFDFTGSYCVYEKSCFRTLVEMLKQLAAGETLLLNNFNTLTHFNVSILFILAKKCFERTGFMSCGSIILNNLLNKDALKYFDVIASECERARARRDGTRDVLTSLPVQVTNIGDFFNSIVFYNNTFYRNKSIQYLVTVQQSL